MTFRPGSVAAGSRSTRPRRVLCFFRRFALGVSPYKARVRAAVGERERQRAPKSRRTPGILEQRNEEKWR